MYKIALLFLSFAALAAADDAIPRATYIANMGAMIEHGDTKIVFDPLFHYEHDTYDRVPPDIEAAILEGKEPWDGIDAVFISHHHGDHFDPATILRLLRTHQAIELFGPEQAAAALRDLVADPDEPILKRVHGLALENGMAATDINFGPLLIEAVRIRHAGWPNRHAHVENIVFRVTLDNETTVMHFGDADVDDAHFAMNPDHWSERYSHLALPPYWFFLSNDGRSILRDRIGAGQAIGLHAPATMPDSMMRRRPGLQDVDVFTIPGESRAIQ